MQKNIIALALLLVLYSSVVSSQAFDVNNSELQMIVTLFRHGARVSSSDGLNLKDKKLNAGELTVVGQRQLFYLGQQLQKDYIKDAKLFKEQYDASELYVRSTDVNRTIMSAQSLLAGLYSAPSGEKIPSEILTNKKDLLHTNFKVQGGATVDQIAGEYPILNGFQPIPIHVVEKSRDKVLLGYGDTCPNELTWNPENQKSEEWKRITKEFQPQIEKFAKIFNLDVSTLDLFTVYNYMDIIIAQQYENKVLPDSYVNDHELQKDMETIYNLRLHLSLYKTPLQKKATVTPFLNNLIKVLDDKLNNASNKQKGYFLSAHDTTLNMVLQGFNMTSWECIEKNYMKTLEQDAFCITSPTKFGASFIVELRKDKTSNKNFIMARYNGEYQKLCDQKSNYCDYQEFKSRVSYFVVPDYDLACGLKQNTQNPETPCNNEMKAIESSSSSTLTFIFQSLMLISITLFL